MVGRRKPLNVRVTPCDHRGSVPANDGPQNAFFPFSAAIGISSDGSPVVGYSNNQLGEAEAFVLHLPPLGGAAP